MPPEIRFCTAADGVTIPYWAIGQGAPVVIMWVPFSHLEYEWHTPTFRSIYENTAQMGRVIRYDHRGFGMSDRHVAEFTIDAMVLDLEAVVDRLELPPLSLFAQTGITAHIAVTYAARHPERLTHLVLGVGAMRLPQAFIDQVDSMLTTHNADWRFISEAFVRLSLGWDDDEFSRETAALLREAIDLDKFKLLWRDVPKWDATPLLPRVTTPTLLIQTKNHPVFGPEHAREIASLMPDARTAVVAGNWEERAAQYGAALGSFLGLAGLASPAAQMPPITILPSGTAIILFADIAESTALTERLGDAPFRERARALDGALRQAITSNGGTAIEGKLLGDGVLATFGAAREAIACATSCHNAADASGLRLHVGVHAGDVIREENNVFGGAVNIAARVAAEAAAGETLVSATVRDLARTSAGVSFEDRGERELKGVGEPVRVFAVGSD